MKKLLPLLFSLLMIIPGCINNQVIDDYYGEDINPGQPYSDFILVDQNNNSYSSENLEGKVVVIAFLFTNCPDICPIVSSHLAWLVTQLGDDVDSKVEIITITVDPWRDTPDILDSYTTKRNLSWTHLTSNTIDNTSRYPDLEKIWGDFGVGINVVEANGTSARHHGTIYEVDHSTGTIIVDKNGYQRVWWGDLEWIPELVLEDIQALM